MNGMTPFDLAAHSGKVVHMYYARLLERERLIMSSQLDGESRKVFPLSLQVQSIEHLLRKLSYRRVRSSLL